MRLPLFPLRGVKLDARRNLQGMTRAEVIALLGNPGFSSETYFLGSGLYGRYDVYRLASAEVSSLHIHYGSKETVTHYTTEPGLFHYDACDKHAPSISPTVLNPVLAGESGRIKLPQLAETLGHAGLRHVREEMKGNRMWAHITYSWRIRDEPHRYFVVMDDIPAQDYTQEALDNRSVSVYSFMTMHPKCLAKK